MSVYGDRRGEPGSNDPLRLVLPAAAAARARAGVNREELFDVSGGVIIQGTSGVTSTGTPSSTDIHYSGRTVATATGYTYSNPADDSGPNTHRDIDIVTFTIPHGAEGSIDEVQVRADSEIGWRFLEFSLVFGGSANAESGSRGSRTVTALTRPFERDGVIPVRKVVKAGTIVRLVATNTDTEAPHLAEGRIRGRISIGEHDSQR